MDRFNDDAVDSPMAEEVPDDIDQFDDAQEYEAEDNAAASEAVESPVYQPYLRVPAASGQGIFASLLGSARSQVESFKSVVSGGADYADPDSPIQSSNLDDIANDALRKLNALAKLPEGTDVSLLKNCTEDEFVERVSKIVSDNNMAMDDPEVVEMMDGLKPLVVSMQDYSWNKSASASKTAPVGIPRAAANGTEEGSAASSLKVATSLGDDQPMPRVMLAASVPKDGLSSSVAEPPRVVISQPVAASSDVQGSVTTTGFDIPSAAPSSYAAAAAAAPPQSRAMPSLPVRATPPGSSPAMPSLPVRTTVPTTQAASPPVSQSAASDGTASPRVAAATEHAPAVEAPPAVVAADPPAPVPASPAPAAAAHAASPVHAPAAPHHNPSPAPPPPAVHEPPESDEFRGTREKLQNIRVKLLRLAKRLGQSPRNTVVAQVLYRLELAEQLKAGRGAIRSSGFSFDRASNLAEELEELNGPESDLDFACTILLLGKTGVGKSATINSIFDAPKAAVNAFAPETTQVREITGHVCGIKVRIIDTPGLQPSASEVGRNARMMASVKKFMKKRNPDIVLYVDRLDLQNKDYGDLPLLRTITATFGASVWFNAIVVLTHGASAPPEGVNAMPISYEMYVAQRSHAVQQMIRQAAGDMRLMNPVSLVENHAACRQNRAGQKVLPNGQIWKPQLLLLCFASKILTEANALLNLQENAAGRSFGGGGKNKVPPLPFLLSSLITSRAPRKAMQEEEYAEEAEPAEDERSKQVAVPAPDPALPPSFDSDNPGHRYRFLESANQWMVRPIVEAHGWDHESGIDGFSVEKPFMLKGKTPANFNGQISKDKKDMSITLESDASIRHGDKAVTTAGIDVQTVGKDMAYTTRCETRVRTAKKNKTIVGVSSSLVAGTLAVGCKLEDRWRMRKGVKLVLSGGTIRARGDTAFGGNMETVFTRTDPNDNTRTTMGASLMNWRGDVALGGNVQSQFNWNKTMLTARANLNSRGAGQVSLRASSNENLKLALFGLIPLFNAVFGRRRE
eukprot:jgi/Mesvir1/18406/Mv14282-RA.1